MASTNYRCVSVFTDNLYVGVVAARMLPLTQLTAARLVIDHTVQQVTGHEGSGDAPQVRLLLLLVLMLLQGQPNELSTTNSLVSCNA